MYIRSAIALLALLVSACASTGGPDSNQRYATLVTNHASPASRAHQVEI